MHFKVRAIYDLLYSRFGPQGWWPLRGKYFPGDYSRPRNAAQAFEVCVGAILTQNTSWKNVEKALECLRAKKLLSFKALACAPSLKIAACVRSSGYYNQKTKKLKAFTDFVERSGGLKKLFSQPVEKL
ncbi:MAG: hypothetical protein ACPL4N_01735, partial [Candidatus Norongarragalinales archaeon]